MGGRPARLVVGAQFTWKGERVTLSSFNDENGSFTALSHTRTEGVNCDGCGGMKVYSVEKIKHRFTITHEILAAEKKMLKSLKDAK